MQDKKQQLEPDMKQWTASKLGKDFVKAVYCHPAYLTSMQSTSCEMLGWMTHKLEYRNLEEPGNEPLTYSLWKEVILNRNGHGMDWFKIGKGVH